MPYVTEQNLTEIARERWTNIPDPRLRQVPVILLTGAAADLPAEPGVAAVIEKPFRMRPLQDVVRSLLAARPDA